MATENKRTWKIQELFTAMNEDLQKCTNSFERGICRAICEKEINKKIREQNSNR